MYAIYNEKGFNYDENGKYTPLITTKLYTLADGVVFIHNWDINITKYRRDSDKIELFKIAYDIIWDNTQWYKEWVFIVTSLESDIDTSEFDDLIEEYNKKD